MLPRYWFIILVTIALPGYAQQSSIIDSLQQKLSSGKGTEKTEALHALAAEYINADIHKSIFYGKHGMSNRDKILVGLSLQNRARTYFYMSDFDKSDSDYLKAESIFIELGLQDRIAMVQKSLADNYFAVRDFKNAAFYANKVLETADRGTLPQLAKEALHILVAINKQMGNYEQALQFLEQHDIIKDTLLNKEKAEQISRLQLTYETNKQQEQMRMLQMHKEKEQALLYMLLGGIIFLGIIGALLYRQQRMRNRKDRMIYISQQALMQEQLKNTRLHEEQLQSEIESKNKELTTYALSFIQKNHLLEDLKEKIRIIKENADSKASPQLSRLLYIISHSFNLDKDWDGFRIYFEQVHHLFFQKLKTRYCKLSNKELRLCALLKLNLSSKEMATILGISVASVKMARYRLRKKLHLDSETDLTTFVINLEKEVS